MIPFFYNLWKTWRHAPLVTTDDPWGYGASLEWATSCPPPRHNFNTIPRIRSERPAFDLHRPPATPDDDVDPDPLTATLGPAELAPPEPPRPRDQTEPRGPAVQREP